MEVQKLVTQLSQSLFLPEYSYYNSDRTSSSRTYLYNHINGTWSSGPELKQSRSTHAAGIVTDEGTIEKLVLVTGGIYSCRDNAETYGIKEVTLNSTEILLGHTRLIGKTIDGDHFD